MSHTPQSLFLDNQNMVLATDLYQLTMMAAYVEFDMEEPATFELFVRRLPRHRSYLVTAGLEQCVHYLLNLRFDGEAIDFLRQHVVFGNVAEQFFERLRAWEFTGNVRAVPEGTIVFPNEAMMQIRAPLFEAQLVETYLLSVINYQTSVASKAARIKQAAGDLRCVDFGTRRAHGPAAGVYAARAAWIGGVEGTSNLLAGKLCNIPVLGTAAHSFIMASPSEEEAFRRYHSTFPEHSTLLIDTYDTLRGARRAAAVEGELKGVRLDSGDMCQQSKQVREILDGLGRPNAKIVASGDLNEYEIEKLIRDGARIDSFGVGTELVTSKDAPALGGVYKLVSRSENGVEKPAIKLAEGKITYPGTKQFWRVRGADGRFDHDVMQLAETPAPSPDAEALLVDVIENGCLVGELPDLRQVQEYCAEQRRSLPDRLRHLDEQGQYELRIGDDVAALVKALSDQHASSSGDSDG